MEAAAVVLEKNITVLGTPRVDGFFPVDVVMYEG